MQGLTGCLWQIRPSAALKSLEIWLRSNIKVLLMQLYYRFSMHGSPIEFA